MTDCDTISFTTRRGGEIGDSKCYITCTRENIKIRYDQSNGWPHNSTVTIYIIDFESCE